MSYPWTRIHSFPRAGQKELDKSGADGEGEQDHEGGAADIQ